MALVACGECGNQISKSAKTCPKCGAKNKARGWSAVAKIVGVILVLWLIVTVFGAIDRAKNGAGTAVATSSPEKNVEIAFDWRKVGFDNILEIDVTLKNRNTFAIKDIEIYCQGSAPSGTRIDSNNKTLFERIEPGQTRSFKKFNMGFLNSQVQKIGCRVDGVKPA
jgi:hypothetical protein